MFSRYWTERATEGRESAVETAWLKAEAEQLAADDLANGEITPEQLPAMVSAYIRWLRNRRTAITH